MIRKVRKADIGTIKQIARSTGNFKQNEIDACLSMAEEALSGDYYLNFSCYEDNGRVVGFVCYGEDEMTRGSWEIYWVAVFKDQQGRGIGKKLMEFIEEEAKKRNGRQIVLETSSQVNYEYVRRFYNKLGYEKIATVPDYFAVDDHKEIYLKRLREHHT